MRDSRSHNHLYRRQAGASTVQTPICESAVRCPHYVPTDRCAKCDGLARPRRRKLRLRTSGGSAWWDMWSAEVTNVTSLKEAQIPLCRLPRGVCDKPVTSPLAQIPLRELPRNFLVGIVEFGLEHTFDTLTSTTHML